MKNNQSQTLSLTRYEEIFNPKTLSESAVYQRSTQKEQTMVPIDNNRYTLDFRLGDMLHMAEELFGPRDLSYTILRVEFVSDHPRIWYPGDRHIVIQLDLSAATNTSQACYQMAHETVHLLSPTGGNHATNFEEGVACYFAAYYMTNRMNEPCWLPDLPSYKRALELITPRLDEDIYCVRRLRDRQPSFLKMGREEISAEFPDLTPTDVDFLISKFDREWSS